jgi:uncharacterized protein YceK
VAVFHSDQLGRSVVLTASVQALRPESRNGFRVVLAQEWVRERFWVVPTALLVAGMAVGLAVSRADSIPGLDEVGGGLPVRPGSAEALLGIIAASMLTFVGVVFTITLVALQLASAQLSPRVIRTFIRRALRSLPSGCSSPRSRTRSSSLLSRVRRPAQMCSASLSRWGFCLCWRAWSSLSSM